MPRPIPHTVHPRWPDRPEGRYSSTVRTDSPEGCAIALIGLPDDTGVKLNKGRIGADEGPAAFRRALARYGVAKPDDRDWPAVFDAGDVQRAGSNAKALPETHERVTEAAAALLDLGLLPVAVGGGHDLTFPFARALAQRTDALEVVYFDPHLDVRAELGSGMPFRALVEQAGVARLHNLGASDLLNSSEHVDWFSNHNGRIHRPDACDELFDAEGPDLAVSFDMDLIDASHAPGVSALNPCGWTPHEASHAVQAAGRCPRVRCFDIMELCPAHDPDGRTARLAAHLFLKFLWGFSDRPA